jgi:hypothetical protein
MVTTLSRAVITELLEPRRGPCLSFYVPTHRFGPEAMLDRLTLESLLHRAEQELEAAGFGAALPKFLRPVHQLLADDAVWQHSQATLAIFLSPDRMWLVRADVQVPPTVELDERFCIAPLIAAMPPTDLFYVLALSMNAVRLLEVTPRDVLRRHLPGLPSDMASALDYHYESEAQVHSAGPRTLGGRKAVVHHGHGGSGDDLRLEKDQLHYFRLVAAALHHLPADAPLVLATVEASVPLFREAVGAERAPLVVILGSPDALTDHELVERGRPLVHEALNRQRVNGALQRFRAAEPRHRTLIEPAEVVTAADRGRVDTLLVAPGTHRWGSYESDVCRVELHAERERGDHDLVDLAVVRTLEQGGQVLTIDPAVTPAGAGMSAILRY